MLEICINFATQNNNKYRTDEPMGYNGHEKSMKKAVLFFAAIVAVVALTSSKLLTKSNVTNAPTSSEIKVQYAGEYIIAYKSAQETQGFYYHSDVNLISDSKTSYSYGVHYRKNPYANANQCSPDKEWCTCFQYTFIWKGTTYYTNR